MLLSKNGKPVDKDNIEDIKIFNPQMVKRRGCTDEKETDKWETFEAFADRVFKAAKVDAGAAKRLWYKRSEVQARLRKWIYELNLESHQNYTVEAKTNPRKLFYNENGKKRTIAEVEAKLLARKIKRHADEERSKERRRQYEESRQDRDRGDRDRDRQGNRSIKVSLKRERDEERKHNFKVVKKPKPGQ